MSHDIHIILTKYEARILEQKKRDKQTITDVSKSIKNITYNAIMWAMRGGDNLKACKEFMVGYDVDRTDMMADFSREIQTLNNQIANQP